MTPDNGGRSSARFWDDAAKDNAAWYVATAYDEESEAFFEQGAEETDALLDLCGVDIAPDDTVLEIGAGVGRMTRRLATLGGRVLATDVSEEMLARARVNLAGCDNVEFVLVPGDGSLPVPSATVDVVFSYIVLQHVPTVDAQLSYLEESLRILGPAGRLAVQVRASGASAMIHEWLGFVAHRVRGRRTMSRAWRGARIPTRRLQGLAAPDVEVRLVRSSRRHIWVVAHKT